MKKLLLTALALTAAATASAQVEIGLKVSPAINYLRTDAPSVYNFKDDGVKFGFGGGLVVDYFFGENYAFGTGLVLTGKGGKFTAFREVAVIDPNDPAIPKPERQDLSVQYIEAPITVKLFTNEVAPDVRLYFQLGGSVAVPIGASINSEKRYTDPTTKQESTALSHVFFIDANALLGLGAEYQLGKSTKVFGGVSYHRGLINTDSYFDDERNPKIQDVSIKNNVFALDLGLKF